MTRPAREAVVPAYLTLCLWLGGSAQGIWSNLLLQLLGAAIITWALIGEPDKPATRGEKQLFILIAASLALVLLQLLPLPPALWTALPGREFIVEGYVLLGTPLPWLPVSLAPYATIATLLTLLTPVAILLAMLRRQAYRPSWLVLALLLGTVPGVVLGVLQVGGEGSGDWYLYPIGNFGIATGFFANGNHFASLLVATIPFLTALLARTPGSGATQRTGVAIIVAAAALIILVGLAINGSLAGIGLGIPVLLASSALMMGRRGSGQRLLLSGTALLLVGAMAAIHLTSPAGYLSSGAETSVESRGAILGQGLGAVTRFAPAGSGLGTFPEVYALADDPWSLDRTFVNHPHNDYLEIAIETGIPGLGLLFLFLLWWGKEAAACWRSATSPPISRAAVIASAAILAHSVVDYPLRTAAIAGVFAMALALIVHRGRASEGGERDELWPTRHWSVDDLTEMERKA